MKKQLRVPPGYANKVLRLHLEYINDLLRVPLAHV